MLTKLTLAFVSLGWFYNAHVPAGSPAQRNDDAGTLRPRAIHLEPTISSCKPTLMDRKTYVINGSVVAPQGAILTPSTSQAFSASNRILQVNVDVVSDKIPAGGVATPFEVKVKGEFGTYSGPIEVVVANKDGKELFRVKQDVSK